MFAIATQLIHGWRYKAHDKKSINILLTQVITWFFPS